ncbi:MAG: enoyl-CoA hydratase/isomerase family protein [Rhodobacteraceae bacterium]|nr:enoyl-CoA hydratase/isomerase family protein [Paracoccaceae bacterium]
MVDIVRSELPGGIVRLTLSRPPVNALSAPMLMALADHMRILGEDADVRAVIVDSAQKVLSAGLDLKEAQGFDTAEQAAVVEGLNMGFLAMYACPKPVVAAVNGAAIAGGLFFVLASDYRVAAPRAVLGLAEVRVGVDFPLGPLEIARAALAPDDLRRLMLGGHPIDAEEALRRGILDEVVAPDDLSARALATAERLAEHPPAAYRAIKAQIRGAVCARIGEGLQRPARANWFTPETRAAMQKMMR